MKTQIQLILATIGLTILIWVYADQQGWKTVEFPIAITVTAPPEYMPRIVADKEDESPQTIDVMVHARGPNAAFREMNLGTPPVFEVQIPIAKENIASDMQRAVDLSVPVAAALHERGLQLAAIKRPSITVIFDRWEKVTVEMQADAGAFTEALQGSLAVEPSTVTARILRSELKDATAAAESRLVLPIEDQLRTQLAQAEFELPISLKDKTWQGHKVTWLPETIIVRGRLQKQYEDLELKMIPLRTMLPWDWPSDKYQVVWVDERDRLQKVQLKMPVGKPTVLANTDVVAFIAIDESLIPPEQPGGATDASATQPAAEPSPSSQTVRFVFPEGFEDAKLVSPPSVVKFRVVKRTQTPAPANSEKR
jgi:hypothetical protein